MKTTPLPLLRPLLLPLLLALPLTLSAGPGAHGPNGEHLDAPPPSAGVDARPRAEMATEGFEAVATLYADELSIVIDRFATNEPVLQARLSVESGGLKADARFHEDHGDYAVDDPKLLALLRQPGDHPLVFTLVAGEESDLLDAVLHVEAPDHDHAPGQLTAREYAALAGAALLLLTAGSWFWRRRTAAGKGGL
jgi:hypothetical protein